MPRLLGNEMPGDEATTLRQGSLCINKRRAAHCINLRDNYGTFIDKGDNQRALVAGKLATIAKLIVVDPCISTMLFFKPSCMGRHRAPQLRSISVPARKPVSFKIAYCPLQLFKRFVAGTGEIE